ncbi:MAG: thioredoxin reductase [Oceanospirillaceae bacterium]|jgi:thioredoxin reductase
MKSYSVIIIGTGPAGMSAANKLVNQGIKCLLLDEQIAAGGQIYRAIDRNLKHEPQRVDLLGEDYRQGSKLTEGLITNQQNECLDIIFNAKVWRIDNNGAVYFSVNQQAQSSHADIIILATGAQERPFAFEGWTLPGVMTAGAAQILLKANGLVADNAILAGNGPLLYLIASQLIKAGSPPKAILETQVTGAWKNALPHFFAALLHGLPYLWKGSKMLASIKKAGIPHYRGINDIQALGNDKITSVSFSQGNKTRTLDTDTLLIHQGVIPNTQISRTLNLQHHWNKQQHAWQPAVNKWGVSSQKNILIAGDGAGIGGAKAAEISGELAALQACYQLGNLSKHQQNEMASLLHRRLEKESAVRPFLDALYAPNFQSILQSDKALICRCEEVTAGQLRHYAREGCRGLNQTKAFSRCGMGACQGRQCGSNAAIIIADERDISVEEVDYYRLRAPIKPVSLSEVASLDTCE